MRRLNITYQGKSVLSDIFNFKAYRIMSDSINGELTPDMLEDAALRGIIAMYDGTEITEDILTSGWVHSGVINTKELTDAIDKVLLWFISVKPAKNPQIIGEPPENPILSLYKSLLEHHLPSKIDKQDPQLLFDVMSAKKSDTSSADDISDDAKEYYGL